MKNILLLFALVVCGTLHAPLHAQVRLPDFKPLMKKQGPAVVNVITTRKPAAAPGGAPGSPPAPGARGQAPEDPLTEFFRRFAPEQGPGERGQPRQGMGSGFIISQDGFVLTNAHVVAGFDDVMVKLADAKREFKAKVIGVDKRTDIALLKVDATGLPVVTLGDSSKVEPGEWVAAIGSPFGFANTITAGIVSAKGRSLPDDAYVSFIQTDVAINPGNSGGPLLNLQGEVVGVNSMIYSGTGGYMGVSFAIPIEVALDVAKQLRSTGKVTRGRIGIGIQPLTKELAQSFKMDATSGAVVVAVEPGAPAEKAGVQIGDVVLAWNGKKIDDPNELPRLVAAIKPGADATMTVWRTGKPETLRVSVGEVTAEADAKADPPAKETNRLGLAVRELPASERKTLGVDFGVLVTDVSRTTAGSPVQPGDVIVAVNQSKFSSLEEFDKLIAAPEKGETVALLVRRGEGALYVTVPVG
ncbi:MAG: DegQ family serine endoprotease [Pseudomonadota bacterium]|nr:DegQ family serine endoprotease [Pseudomonadota bacterium]